MARKFRTFVPGGLQKSVTLPDGTSSTQGTQIAGFAGQILTIDQLKTLLGLNNPNTQTPSGGTSGGSGTAAITLGEGLAGGGPLIGNVRIFPVSTGQGMFAEDAPDEQPSIPGPIGMRGQQGPVGPIGPAIYLSPDEPIDDFSVVPGPPGPVGPQGPQGNPGVSGTSAPVVFFPDDPQEDYAVVPGPRGLQGIQGPAGPPGSGGSAGQIWLETDVPDIDTMPGFSLPGGFTGFGAPTALVGLTAVAGASRLAMRSDAAPALDQSIAPTWTGTHSFIGSINFSTGFTGVSIGVDPGVSVPEIILAISSGAANDKFWSNYADGTSLHYRTINDAFNAAHDWLAVTRNGVSITSIGVGNSADAPPITLNGPVIIPAPPATNFALRTFGVNGQWNTVITGGAGAGGAYGLLIEAGTNTSDFAFYIQDQSATVDYFRVRGDGAIQGRGPTANAVVDMTPDSSTFTGVGTGFSATVPTYACTWYRIGKMIVLTINYNGIVGTSNANTWTMTGLPAAIQPATGGFRNGPLNGQQIFDNGSVTGTTSIVEYSVSGGTITFYKGGLTTGWTNGGTKGLNTSSITLWYPLY